MKDYFKETWGMYVIVFVFCFMHLLYEPLLLYINNVADFWFDISTMFKMSFFWFAILLLIILIILNTVYFLNRNKNKKIFNTCVIILFVIFICSYIQGNFLVGNLPLLDGKSIAWNNYIGDWIISVILWIVVILGVIFAIKKKSLKKVLMYSGFISIAIFLMLSSSLLTQYIANHESLDKDFISITTTKNISEYSDNKNFIILLLDGVDSRSFIQEVNKYDDFNGIFNDFTYFPDTMSGHPFTMESIPLILTGKYYENEEPINTWSTKAYKESVLFNMIEENDYKLNVYEKELLYNDKSATRIENMHTDNFDSVKRMKFLKQEMKYVLFRYLPSFLKRFSNIESMDFSADIVKKYRDDDKPFNDQNQDFIKVIRESNIDIVDEKVFKFIHLEGAHVAFTFDKDLNDKENANYYDEVDGCITIVKEYLERLKKSNIYDNSIIIVMSDHGFNVKEITEGRQNPILFVKGFNEKRDKMNISDKPVHYVDLMEMYSDLFSGKRSNELFNNISKDRTRRYLMYDWPLTDSTAMIEYETRDKAWETEKMKATGKEYKR